jgi:hypothetical protein
MVDGEEELERMVGKIKEYCEEWTRGHCFEQLLGEVSEIQNKCLLIQHLERCNLRKNSSI